MALTESLGQSHKIITSPSSINSPGQTFSTSLCMKHYRSPWIVSTAILLGGLPRTPEHLCAVCLGDCKHLWTVPAPSSASPRSWLGAALLSLLGHFHPESCCLVMSASVSTLPGAGNQPAHSSLFPGAQAQSSVPTSLAPSLWQPELRVPPRFADYNQFPCSTPWELLLFRHPVFSVSPRIQRP